MNYFNSKTGLFRFSDGTIASAYSGTGDGKNNPEMEAFPNEGPIPVGKWSIGSPRDDIHMGPYILPLEPIGHDAHGRSHFYIHGDNAAHDASHGCIIMSPAGLRRKIYQSGDHMLLVTNEVT